MSAFACPSCAVLPPSSVGEMTLRLDREKYVGAILGFLDQMIGRFKNLLSQEPSYEILEHWTRKAELQITFGSWQRLRIAPLCAFGMIPLLLEQLKRKISWRPW